MFDSGPRNFSAAFLLQSKLNNLFDRNKASISMYDEMIKLFNEYITSPEFNQFSELQPRKQFIASSASMFVIKSMAPEYAQVRLKDNTVATVPVFDARAMILSLLHDPILMKKENFAEGYNIFTGEEWDDDECNQNYGEIHTAMHGNLHYRNTVDATVNICRLRLCFLETNHTQICMVC
jgi:hypothetical protein